MLHFCPYPHTWPSLTFQPCKPFSSIMPVPLMPPLITLRDPPPPFVHMDFRHLFHELSAAVISTSKQASTLHLYIYISHCNACELLPSFIVPCVHRPQSVLTVPYPMFIGSTSIHLPSILHLFFHNPTPGSNCSTVVLSSQQLCTFPSTGCSSSLSTSRFTSCIHRPDFRLSLTLNL